jgi:MSHA biogenesis protein MshJ
MDALRSHWTALALKVDALSLRERGMIFAALLAVLFFVWDRSFAASAQATRAELARTLAQTEAQLQAAEQAMRELAARAGIDPNAGLRNRLRMLDQERQALDVRKAAFEGTLIVPRRMLELLRGVLAGHEGLKLVGLRTYPATPLFETPVADATPAPKGDAVAPAVYRHDLEIEFEGSYFQVLDYLRALERQPLFWDSIAYEVKTYPTARVRLRVYTLSLDKAWLGV